MVTVTHATGTPRAAATSIAMDCKMMDALPASASDAAAVERLKLMLSAVCPVLADGEGEAAALALALAAVLALALRERVPAALALLLALALALEATLVLMLTLVLLLMLALLLALTEAESETDGDSAEEAVLDEDAAGDADPLEEGDATSESVIDSDGDNEDDASGDNDDDGEVVRDSVLIKLVEPAIDAEIEGETVLLGTSPEREGVIDSDGRIDEEVEGVTGSVGEDDGELVRDGLVVSDGLDGDALAEGDEEAAALEEGEAPMVSLTVALAAALDVGARVTVTLGDVDEEVDTLGVGGMHALRIMAPLEPAVPAAPPPV